jgi:hypothetical protein
MNRAYLLLTVAVATIGGAFYAGQWVARDAALAAKRDTVRVELLRLDTVYQRDTVRLTRWRERWDTVRTTVNRWKHDTVEVVRFVQVADSTIRACVAALATCEQQKAALTRRAELAEEAYRRTIVQVPSSRRQALTHAAAAALGVVIARAAR